MRVSYCDYCGTPIKGYRWIVILAKFKENPGMGDVSEEPNDFLSYSYAARNYVLDEKREICEGCYHLMKDIFSNRMERQCDRAEEIRHIYDLPPKDEKNEQS